MTTATQRYATAVRPAARPQHVPFRDAEEAWFWTMSALVARRDGARSIAGMGLVSRPCEPDDVVKCIDRLYRQRRIDLAHARILRIWGKRGERPDGSRPREFHDHRLWREALDRMEWPLRVKGIIADEATNAPPGLSGRS